MRGPKEKLTWMFVPSELAQTWFPWAGDPARKDSFHLNLTSGTGLGPLELSGTGLCWDRKMSPPDRGSPSWREEGRTGLKLILSRPCKSHRIEGRQRTEGKPH